MLSMAECNKERAIFEIVVLSVVVELRGGLWIFDVVEFFLFVFLSRGNICLHCL